MLGPIAGVTGTVYRTQAVDRNGDPVDADGNVIPGAPLLGTISGLIIGEDLAVMSLRALGSGSTGGVIDRADVGSATGLIGAPRNASILLRHGDRVAINSSTGEAAFVYAIYGPRLYDQPNPLTGSDFGYYWVRAEAIVG
jgi:hypothetical protein